MTLPSKSDNIKVMVYDDAIKIIEELSESLFSRYQINWFRDTNERQWFYLQLCLLYYKFDKVIFKRGGSYIDSPD